jgi:hypothetical protein
MMNTWRQWGMTMLLAVMVLGCSRPEKIMVKNDGLWKEMSLRTKTYLNDQALLDITVNSNLGQMYFGEDGNGWYQDGNGATTSYVWGLNADQDALSRTDANGTVWKNDILDISRKSMTLFATYSTGVFPTIVKLETTTVLERVK